MESKIDDTWTYIGDDDTWTYIGDGLYAKHDGFGIIVVSYDGIGVLNEIYLEPQVLAALNNIQPPSKP